ncbi:TetR/AcrR family transcriptional regulator [Aurantimonas sp. 22II-16-19i]|uniref:TetR/AcrR family transcriptional regulator n=1 Tax=Aurantimonas sp. 22II-16-19i TaxID=1317114 RepID=UPI0009F7C4F4|nr:TetR/AcrR family transcriptional regulator [Aurantimonas sp. 22II-16-19i]ORE94007.1 TetR family transcriptional regulator [Aurantimonas sp. 22II-16-19i]
MKPSPAPPARRTGRPLSFDRDAALVTAMHLFWRHGYEATSVADLTRAMGITPPSLYAAFGDKRRLFLEAVHRYLGGLEAVERSIADAVSAHDAARDLLVAAALGDTGTDTPPGCLLASSLVTSSAEADAVREALAGIRRGIEAALSARIARDISEGLLPSGSDAEMLAGHVFAVVQGMSTLAKDGAGRAKLMGIAEAAMAGWPKTP